MPKNSLLDSIVVPSRLVFMMWLSYTLEYYYQWDIGIFGIVPRTAQGLIGIVTAPIIHGSLPHLISNTVPMLTLGWMLYYFYPKVAPTVFYRSYFGTNLLVWLFAWPGHVHIGASGIIYSITAFLIVYGLMVKHVMSMVVSLVVIFIYGGIFYGVLPTDPMVSWESHLAGSLVGLGSAITLSKSKRT